MRHELGLRAAAVPLGIACVQVAFGGVQKEAGAQQIFAQLEDAVVLHDLP